MVWGEGVCGKVAPHSGRKMRWCSNSPAQSRKNPQEDSRFPSVSILEGRMKHPVVDETSPGGRYRLDLPDNNEDLVRSLRQQLHLGLYRDHGSRRLKLKPGGTRQPLCRGTSSAVARMAANR